MMVTMNYAYDGDNELKLWRWQWATGDYNGNNDLRLWRWQEATTTMTMIMSYYYDVDNGIDR